MRLKPQIEALLERLRAASPNSSIHYAALGLGDEAVKGGPWAHVVLEFQDDGMARILAHGMTLRDLLLSAP